MLLLIFDVCVFFWYWKKLQHQSCSRITMMTIIKAIMKIYITYNVIIYLYNSSISTYPYMPSRQQALDSLNYFKRVCCTSNNFLGYSVHYSVLSFSTLFHDSLAFSFLLHFFLALETQPRQALSCLLLPEHLQSLITHLQLGFQRNLALPLFRRLRNISKCFWSRRSGFTWRYIVELVWSVIIFFTEWQF